MRTNYPPHRVSATREDYLRAIYLLTHHGGDASVTDIAKKLGLSKSTVSERLKDLAYAQLIMQAPYGKVSLTPEGIKLGKGLTHKHRLIEVFLHNTLGMPEDQIHQEADVLEHALSDEVIRRLGMFLKQPTHDPHGSQIPTLD